MRRFAIAIALLVLSLSALGQGTVTTPEQAFAFASDVTAQAMPLGVKAVFVQAPFEAGTTEVHTAPAMPGSLTAQTAAHGYTFVDEHNSSLSARFALLKQGNPAYRISGPGQHTDTLYIPQQRQLEATVTQLATKLLIHVQPVRDVPQGPALKVRLPRIALDQSWMPPMMDVLRVRHRC